jgi:hypothetical protein
MDDGCEIMLPFLLIIELEDLLLNYLAGYLFWIDGYVDEQRSH